MISTPVKKTNSAKLMQALRATKKLLVVRHPFERLLSAYRDKLENSVAGREHGTLHFYRKYGGKIVEKYRGESRQIIDRSVRIRCSSIGLIVRVFSLSFFKRRISHLLRSIWWSDERMYPYQRESSQLSVNSSNI